jgi:hypothetical protein
VTTDWRRFVAAREGLVLPYFGGPYVHARDRRLRVEMPPAEPGWWHFVVTGRTARPTAPAGPPDLSHLPAVRGHSTDGYLIRTGSHAEALDTLAGDQPARFAPLVARRWPPGYLLADMPDFEGDAEETARRAFEDGGTLAGVRGMPASVRAAFGYAVCLRVARARALPVAPAEIRPQVGTIADQGEEAAVALLDRLVAERARAAALARTMPRVAVRATAPTSGDTIMRVETALRAAGACLTELRRLNGGLLEVRWRFAGERFSSLVNASTLGVVDAGICLSGHDRLVTLESLPSVVREAMETGALAMTRWG